MSDHLRLSGPREINLVEDMENDYNFSMDITVKDVEYVARLARLKVSAAEKEMFAGQLQSILHYIDQLAEVDTSAVAPTSHALNLANVMREDRARPPDPLERERLLGNAPERDGDYFRVQKVIE